MYNYKAKLVRCVDGDTADLEVDYLQDWKVWKMDCGYKECKFCPC